MSRVRAVVVRPNRPFKATCSVEEVDDALASLQAIVGGYLEDVVTALSPEVRLLVNEDGRHLKLPLTFQARRALDTVEIRGAAVFVGVDGTGELRSLTDEEIAAVRGAMLPL